MQWAPQVASAEDTELIHSFGDTEVQKRKAFEQLEQRTAQTEAELNLARQAGVVGGLLEPRKGLHGVIADAIVEGLGDLDEEEKLAALLGSDPIVVPPGFVPLVGPPIPKGLVFVQPHANGEPLAAELWNPKFAAAALSSSGRTENADATEAALAARLLGELPAFPRAEMTDILDVRERLSDARVRFRQAVTMAGRELSGVPAEDFEREVDAYRRRHIDPALTAIREELEELRAVPTLLRSLEKKWAVPTIASLALGVAMLDPGAVAAVATSSAGVALGAHEALVRREIKRRVQQQPFWFLHEVQRRLDKR